ncbi:hypothetical protein EPIR_3100 [Erwinia piriflorinigrans CFBP 5888]|uniref:Uncharacterized protein n=1 Tax=Erwinia piriflorinigrans CFBP 5888 TaxID=1161919 RepID=V5ZAQ0_9GAMM|nr:hypothetical protein EPIR_3100 [Erwinia piriflorinigrans CFBP 5888]
MMIVRHLMHAIKWVSSDCPLGRSGAFGYGFV